MQDDDKFEDTDILQSMGYTEQLKRACLPISYPLVVHLLTVSGFYFYFFRTEDWHTFFSVCHPHIQPTKY